METVILDTNIISYIFKKDAWIAATALQYKLPLVTHNPDDFNAVDNLEIISIISMED